MKRIAVIVLLLIAVGASGTGAVIGENTDELPPGCQEISGWKNITVRAGTPYAKQFHGTVYTYGDRSFRFDPCTKLTVTFINNDSVRHQWMVHGLPATVYPMGMFTLEVDGPGRATGTFILPSHQETLLVHCSVPQHMQKGMKAQIKVGGGDGNIANIPGVSGSYDRYDYPRESPLPAGLTLAFAAAVMGALVAVLVMRRRG